jgi:hypothetical protein
MLMVRKVLAKERLVMTLLAAMALLVVMTRLEKGRSWVLLELLRLLRLLIRSRQKSWQLT